VGGGKLVEFVRFAQLVTSAYRLLFPSQGARANAADALDALHRARDLGSAARAVQPPPQRDVVQPEKTSPGQARRNATLQTMEPQGDRMTGPVELATPRHSGYRHEAFFYRGDADFVAGGVPFIQAGLDAGEPVMVAVVPHRIDLLRQALGSRADTVSFVDMAEIGRNPARIIPAWSAFLADKAVDGQPVRGIGEPVWAGRHSEEIVECQFHEALLNLAVDPDTSFWLRCPYDTEALPATVIDAVQLSHPVLAGPDEFRGSTGYAGLHHVQSVFGSPLPEPLHPTKALRFGADDLPTLRQLVARSAAATGLNPDRVADLDVAVHEIATNSLRHAGGGGRFRTWSTDDFLTYEISDRGHIENLLVGRVAPDLTSEGGRGVWLANQLSDLVQIRSSADGTTVRILSRL